MTENIKKTIEIISLPVNSTIRQALQSNDYGGLGLVFLIDPETRRFMGLVTDGDIRRALLAGYGLESPVVNVPRPKPRVANISMSHEEIAALLTEPVHVVPILNETEQVIDIMLLDQRVHLPVAEPFLGERELQYVSECVLTGWVSSAGKFVVQFEKMFAEFCGTHYAIANSNGTAALHLAMLALGIGPGDEVIVPTLTFIATANAVTFTGAHPVFVDSETDTWNIDPELIEKAITPHTRAIIPVHLYGHPADMDPIIKIAAEHHLAVVEDAAEAHGARYKKKRVGGIGDIGAFSFYGNKIITTGEGGMVVTNREDIAEKIRRLRDHGMSPERHYWHTMLGYNYRMTNLQAALGVAQMEKVEAILETKRKIAHLYREGLSGINGIELMPQKSWAESIYWMFSILVDETGFGMSRSSLMEYLEGNDVETRPFFPPIHTQPIYNTGQKLPIAEHLSRVGINLPSGVTTSTRAIQHVCDCIRAASRGKSQAKSRVKTAPDRKKSL
jgi:perosamine synthetase